MAVAWEINMINEEAISPEILSLIIKEYKNDINVTAIVSMDDWGWSNKRQLDSIAEITEELDKGKIITIEMQSKQWKSLGMFVEKEGVYLYTFWINTDGFPELDVDKITDANRKYYNQVYHILDRLIEEYNLPFNYIAIGLESDVRCYADIRTAISNSNNVIVWLIKKGNNTILPENSKRQKVSEKLEIIVIK
mgnify:FL=1